jgi:hypothetical protein
MGHSLVANVPPAQSPGMESFLVRRLTYGSGGVLVRLKLGQLPWIERITLRREQLSGLGSHSSEKAVKGFV